MAVLRQEEAVARGAAQGQTLVNAGSDLKVNLEDMPFSVDAGIGSRASLGLLVLETDQTVEHEFRCLLPPSGVALYGARLHNDAVITPESLKSMHSEIAPAARLLPPSVELDAIGYACTSGALFIGESVVADQIGRIRAPSKVTDPVTAVRAALSALNVERIALLTPYQRDINVTLRARLQQRGVAIPVMGSFNEAQDDVVARIDQRSIYAAILALGRSRECDAVFVSCTSLRVAEIAADAERELGKPVTSSNHALAWHMLRLAGINDLMPESGRLFATLAN
jgi:maleate isomerase